MKIKFSLGVDHLKVWLTLGKKKTKKTTLSLKVLPSYHQKKKKTKNKFILLAQQDTRLGEDLSSSLRYLLCMNTTISYKLLSFVLLDKNLWSSTTLKTGTSTPPETTQWIPSDVVSATTVTTPRLCYTAELTQPSSASPATEKSMARTSCSRSTVVSSSVTHVMILRPPFSVPQRAQSSAKTVTGKGITFLCLWSMIEDLLRVLMAALLWLSLWGLWVLRILRKMVWFGMRREMGFLGLNLMSRLVWLMGLRICCFGRLLLL